MLSLCFFGAALPMDDTSVVASKPSFVDSSVLEINESMLPTDEAAVKELSAEEIAAIDNAEDILEALDIPVDDSLVVKIKIICGIIKDTAGPHWEEHKTKYLAATIGLLAAYVIYLKYNSQATVAA